MRTPELKGARRRAQGGFTLVELTVVVVISTLALTAIYQTLITQERTYRYQSAAIDAQGTSRMALQVIASELREISAAAGQGVGLGGTDLLMASEDTLRVRAFRKVGIVCALADAGTTVDVWVPGTAFASGDQVLIHQAGNTNTMNDDRWGNLPVGLTRSGRTPACASRWPTYPVQNLTGLAAGLVNVQPGSMIRSYVTVGYGNFVWDGVNVLGRRTGVTLEPLVGPLLPPDSGGVTFRYFDNANTELTALSSDAQRSAVSRILITVRSVSRGGDPMGGDWVDSASTNVYLRGN